MIEELRQSLRALERPAGLEDAGCLPLSVPAIDGVLGGGLTRGALHEIAAAGEAHVAAAAGFAVAVCRCGGTRAPQTLLHVSHGERSRAKRDG